MSKTDAEYMRAYRARRKAEADARETAAIRLIDKTVEHDQRPLLKRIAELEAEVKHLKEELAKRPVVEEPITMPNGDAGHQWRRAPYSEPGFNSRPFTPAPKKGK